VAKRPKNKKIEDNIVDKWIKDESEVLIPAGENIFGQPTEPMTQEDLMMMVSGYVSPFSTIKAAKSYFNLVGGVKGWRGYKLPSWFSKNQANEIIEKTSVATGIPKGKLLKFAEQKISGAKSSIKENRQIVSKVMKERGIKDWKGSKPPHGRIFGGWKGGIKYDIKGTINDKDMNRFLNEVLKGASER
jgi:ribosomal protein L17